MTKVCTKCGEEKPLDEFTFIKKGTNKKCAVCKICRNAIATTYRRSKRPEIICPRCGTHFLKSKPTEEYCDPCKPLHKKEYAIMKADAWKANNQEQARAWSRNKGRKGVKIIGDNYCKNLLTSKGFDRDKITPDLISFQRALIKLQRTIKEIA